MEKPSFEPSNDEPNAPHLISINTKPKRPTLSYYLLKLTVKFSVAHNIHFQERRTELNEETLTNHVTLYVGLT